MPPKKKKQASGLDSTAKLLEALEADIAAAQQQGAAPAVDLSAAEPVVPDSQASAALASGSRQLVSGLDAEHQQNNKKKENRNEMQRKAMREESQRQSFKSNRSFQNKTRRKLFRWQRCGTRTIKGKKWTDTTWQWKKNALDESR